MFNSLFPWFFPVTVASKVPEQPEIFSIWQQVTSSETNNLLITDRQDIVDRFYENIYSNVFNGKVFTNNLYYSSKANTKNFVEYCDNELENIILKQKSLLDFGELVPFVLVFDRCISHNDENYKRVVRECKNLAISTITIVKSPKNISVDLIKNMDNVFVFKEKSKKSQYINLAWIFEKFYKNTDLEYIKFKELVINNVAHMKVIMLEKTKIAQVTLGKETHTVKDIFNDISLKTDAIDVEK